MQHELLVLERKCATFKAHSHYVVIEVSNLRPAQAHLGAQQLGMTATSEGRIGIVIDHRTLLPPEQHHGHPGAKQQTGCRFQSLRPVGDRTEQRTVPRKLAHQASHLATTLKEHKAIVDGTRCVSSLHHRFPIVLRE
jgi:hypothetical protein